MLRQVESRKFIDTAKATLEIHGSFFRISIPRKRLVRCLEIDGLQGWQPSNDSLLEFAVLNNASALRIARLQQHDSGTFYLIFRGTSVISETKRAGALPEEVILDIVFWNDAAAIYFNRSGSWTVATNRACSIPVFWRKTKDCHLFSNQAVPTLKAIHDNWEIDRIGWAEALLWDTPLRERTILSDIHQIPAGHRLELSQSEVRLASYKTLKLSGPVAGNPVELAEEIDTLQRLAVEQAVGGLKNVIVPLSGGLDSRCILGYLLDLGKKTVTAISFGHAHSFELLYARRVADTFCVPWRRYVLDRQHYLGDFTKVYLLSAGISHLMHCHGIGAIKNQTDGKGQVLTGFMGDPVQGADCCLYPEITSADKAVDHLLKKALPRGDSVLEFFPQDVVDGIREDISKIYGDCAAKNDSASFDEYYFVVERQSKLITHIFNSMLPYCDSISFPFMCGDWARFFLSLAPSLRINRYIYKLSLAKRFPKLTSIPDTSNYVPMAMSGRCAQIRHIQRHITSSSQRILQTVTKGLMSFPNPFQTENLPYIINKVLHCKLEQATENLIKLGLMNKSLSTIIKPRLFPKLSCHAAYRVISLNQLLESVGNL